MSSQSASVQVRDAFFGEADALLTTELCVFSLIECTADPLTVFGNLAIRSGLSCILTTDGLSPFSADLRVLIPYKRMTVPQLHAVRAIARNMHEHNTTRYKHPNGNFSASCKRDSGKVFVDASIVLFALNVLILRAVDGRSLDVNTVINVTQQRVLATVNVHRSQLARADELTRSYVAAKKTSEPSSLH